MQTFVPTSARRYECPVVLPRFFGPRQCERIRDSCLALDRDEGLVDSGTRGGHDESTRKAGISWWSPDEHNLWVFEKLASAVEKANRIYQYDLIGFTEDIQFTRYDTKGSFYDWHQDGLEGELANRKLSLVVQLSSPEDYVGADLEMFSLCSDPEVGRQWRDDLRGLGTVIVFPAFEFHRVTPLTQGQRFSLVCWVGGPPFR